ncbi:MULTISPECIES: glycosyltransferase family 25 protein [unclassified Moraxella]|uniref:glycosyltransferase family 25 protein n=1 Tax=unclassified Moraxella TaxID=2685852 RepID=UPI002B410CE2|nr:MULTISPECIES: glycosyltransferase family 25 protein [unclassified Moraxella]
MMKNYVISLTTANDRRTHICQEFGKQGIDFEFFDAVTPNQLVETAQSLKIDLNKNQLLSNNELACLLSHISLWKKAIDENMDYIAIFEDDIYLSKDAHLFLNHSDWIKNDWGFIKIEKTIEKALLKNPTPLQENHTISLLNSVHLATGGYILSKTIAQQLYHHFLSLNNIGHIDQFLFKTVLEENIAPIYQINPVLCIQDCILYPDNQKFLSSLEWRDSIKNNKASPPLHKKIVREFQRLLKQIYDYIFFTKMRLIFKR